MPRPLRLEYDGALYHLLSRGDRREDIFWSDADRTLFLGTLDRACEKTWRQKGSVLAICTFSLLLTGAGDVLRPLRIEYEGAMYHLLSRGDRREDIYWDDRDREVFLDLLGQACARTGWEVHASCLMSNHFRSETDLEVAARIVAAGMKELGWQASDLAFRRKGDPAKVVLARQVREQTALSLQWIAERLQMGSWSYVGNLLRQAESANSED